MKAQISAAVKLTVEREREKKIVHQKKKMEGTKKGSIGVSSALNTHKLSHTALPILVISLWTQPLAVTTADKH